MGLEIGQNPARIAGEDAFASARARRARREAARRDTPALGAARETPEPVRAGFGKNTLSPPAAALITLGANLERAREVVPSFEELRAELRAAREAAARQEAQAQAGVVLEQGEGADRSGGGGAVGTQEGAAIPGLGRAAREAYAPGDARDRNGQEGAARGAGQAYARETDPLGGATAGLNLLA